MDDSIETLSGDPTLELFTEGSRLMRAYYPAAPFELARRLERIEASSPLNYIVQGDYAVATSERPAHGFVPVLLHRESGLWRIDLVETWKNLFFYGDGNYFLRNSDTPYAFGLRHPMRMPTYVGRRPASCGRPTRSRRSRPGWVPIHCATMPTPTAPGPGSDGRRYPSRRC